MGSQSILSISNDACLESLKRTTGLTVRFTHRIMLKGPGIRITAKGQTLLEIADHEYCVVAREYHNIDRGGKSIGIISQMIDLLIAVVRKCCGVSCKVSNYRT